MRATSCARWPKTLRLVSSAGHMVPGRCRATNKCEYCSRLAAVEFSEMLALDAMKGDAPRVWAVLTTREEAVLMRQSPARLAEQRETFYRAREFVMRAVKRRWPAAEYVCVLEFTTGYAHARGIRLPHWNLLIKGVQPDDLAELEAIIKRVWCAKVDALPQAQFVGAVSEVGGLMRYLALHFLKESQRPPDGWRGQRVTASRGYFGPIGKRGAVTERALCRQDARDSLRLKREIRRQEANGSEGNEAVVLAEIARLRASSVRWDCVVVSIDRETGVVSQARRLDGSESHAMRLDRGPILLRRLHENRDRAAYDRGELLAAQCIRVWTRPQLNRQLPLFRPRRD